MILALLAGSDVPWNNYSCLLDLSGRGQCNQDPTLSLAHACVCARVHTPPPPNTHTYTQRETETETDRQVGRQRGNINISELGSQPGVLIHLYALGLKI